MAGWSREDLGKIAGADDLHISPFREDGITYGTPTWIWSVAVDDALFVRAYNGRSSRWYQAAVRQKVGRIIAAGMSKEAGFEPVEGPINDRIEDAMDKEAGAVSDDLGQRRRDPVNRSLSFPLKGCMNWGMP